MRELVVPAVLVALTGLALAWVNPTTGLLVTASAPVLAGAIRLAAGAEAAGVIR